MNSAANGLPRRVEDHSPHLDRVIQAQIGDKLRAMYGDLVEQPVPDRIAAILARLGSLPQDKGS